MNKNNEEEKIEFTEEQKEDLNQKINKDGIPEFDVRGTLESLEAYSHFIDQCPEDNKQEVLKDVKQKTDAWQKVFDGFKEALEDPKAKAELRKLIIESWKK